MSETKGDLERMQVEALSQIEWLTTEGGLSLSEIGRRIGQSHVQVSRWVNRHNRPTRRSCRDVERLYTEVRQDKAKIEHN